MEYVQIGPIVTWSKTVFKVDLTPAFVAVWNIGRSEIFSTVDKGCFDEAAEGLLIPATSRRYSRASAAEPLATAVACDVPLNSMYIERVLLCVPVAHTNQRRSLLPQPLQSRCLLREQQGQA